MQRDRNIAKVLGDFSALIGMLEFFSGAQTLGALLLGAGLLLYGIGAACTMFCAGSR